MQRAVNYKLNRLKKIFKQMNACLVAYSGGVDSSLLLRVARQVLKNNVLAVTAVSETYPREELSQAKKMASDLRVRHIVIKTKEYNNPEFKKNPITRCFYCKKELFSKLRSIAKQNEIDYVLDGSNLDDSYDFRPGDLAKKIFKIRSPLKEAGFRKKDIRFLSKTLRLPTWTKPSLACLASRFPYGVKFSKRDLTNIDRAEKFIRSLGIQQVRVRCHGDLIRIEVDKKDIPKLINKHQTEIIKYLKRFCYNYITVDLQGYRTGSMNEPIKDKLLKLKNNISYV